MSTLTIDALDAFRPNAVAFTPADSIASLSPTPLTPSAHNSMCAEPRASTRSRRASMTEVAALCVPGGEPRPARPASSQWKWTRAAGCTHTTPRCLRYTAYPPTRTHARTHIARTWAVVRPDSLYICVYINVSLVAADWDRAEHPVSHVGCQHRAGDHSRWPRELRHSRYGLARGAMNDPAMGVYTGVESCPKAWCG
jgi:hypothetical protein